MVSGERSEPPGGSAGRIEQFRRTAARHGLSAALRHYALRAARRLVVFEVCCVETNAEVYPTDWVRSDYQTRALTDHAFHSSLCPELAGSTYPSAFARGDLCVASLEDGRVVGFTFYTREATRVVAGVEFRFPPRYLYSYASSTALDHRGRRLESTRWHAAQTFARTHFGVDLPRVFYRNLENLEARAANRRSPGNTRLGYTGYVLLRGRPVCFRSPGCRRAGVGFWPSGQGL